MVDVCLSDGKNLQSRSLAASSLLTVIFLFGPGAPRGDARIRTAETRRTRPEAERNSLERAAHYPMRTRDDIHS